jgi:hypothetical protein
MASSLKIRIKLSFGGPARDLHFRVHFLGEMAPHWQCKDVGHEDHRQNQGSLVVIHAVVGPNVRGYCADYELSSQELDEEIKIILRRLECSHLQAFEKSHLGRSNRP